MTDTAAIVEALESLRVTVGWSAFWLCLVIALKDMTTSIKK